MSRGFVATLAGIGVTLLAWYGPWEWPGWPAFTAISLVFGNNFSELPSAARAASIVALIAINSGFWGLLVYAAAVGVARVVLTQQEVLHAVSIGPDPHQPLRSAGSGATRPRGDGGSAAGDAR